MFNRQPFNRGRFNQGIIQSVFLEGNANISLKVEADLIATRAIEGKVDLDITAEGSIDCLVGLEGSASLDINLSGIMIVPRYFRGDANITIVADNIGIIRGRIFDRVYLSTNSSKFNRMQFNRGKFNSSSHLTNKVGMNFGTTGHMNITKAIRGLVEMEFDTSTIFNTSSNYKGNTDIILDSKTSKLNIAKKLQASATIEFTIAGRINAAIPYQGSATMSFQSMVSKLNKASGLQGVINIIFETQSEGFLIYRYEHIYLPALSIAVGGELIIDTDNMTITLNGQNVMQHLSRDSEFFLINPAINETVYTSNNANNRADIRILWKDAWL